MCSKARVDLLMTFVDHYQLLTHGVGTRGGGLMGRSREGVGGEEVRGTGGRRGGVRWRLILPL